MSSNDVIVLNAILEQRRAEIAKSIREDDYFEVFSFEQILKNNDLSYEELESGKIGSGDDGGIDGFFLFINDELVDEDFSHEEVKRNPKMDLVLIQAKQSSSFSETAMDKVISTAFDIFDLSKKERDIKGRYNSFLVKKITQFKDIYVHLARRHPQLSVKFVYASKGDNQDVHHKVEAKGKSLIDIVTSKFAGSECTVGFIGARQLLDAARTEKTYTLQLRFLENYISRGEDNYVILSKITDYCDFVSDERGSLRKYIFESNVRDYQGEVEVNKDIRLTLEHEDTLDFWYLNNGVTILASNASIVGKTITLDDIQVVNGLQTTTTIFNYLTVDRERWKDEGRAILVRIIVTKDPEARDRIIKATNNQTTIPTASLRATDRIQRDIEEYLLQNGWYYDRRKNYYKNQGKPSDRIVSIPYMAQCIMSIILKEPDNARARPSSLIKHNDDYKKVFNEEYGLKVYLTCSSLMKKIEYFLKDVPEELDDYIQFRFHLGMMTVINILGRSSYSVAEVTTLSIDTITNDLLMDVFEKMVGIIDEYKSKHQGSLDKISKTRDLVENLIQSL
ncbi:MAG: AIPR family protein [Paenibacillus macerans]|uniref:AIPR family protein n=1 Tax=Paenibacillus TaxID=44249 RepID=UPI0018C2B30C|nr:AIPR family protein [Paenibacillus macerans]MBS5909584.1 AIPR family protein [Paenibacillus macerans]MDU7471827.1 AIPR family protein [Paenibacillus macerans]UMV48585.1 AIPR family protein [Paenibacillus macerans]